MGLLVLIVGLVLFLGVHALTTQRSLRARMIASLGEGGYKIGYALASLAGLALIVWGFGHYRATGSIDVWYPPRFLKQITVALMLPAVILVVASYIRGRIYAAVKHPMLAGVKLWAAAHLIAGRLRTGAPRDQPSHRACRKDRDRRRKRCRQDHALEPDRAALRPDRG